MRATASIIAKRGLLAMITSAIVITISPAMALGLLPHVEQHSRQSPPQRTVERREAAQKRVESRRQDRPPRGNDTPESVEPQRSAQPSETADDNCPLPYTKLIQAMERFSAKTSSHLTTFDQTHQRLESFYKNSQLVDPDYDDLNSMVLTARQQTTLRQTDLADQLSDVSCNEDTQDTTVADQVQAFRDQSQLVIDSLKVYQSSLVLLIQSLRAETTDQNQPDDSGSTDQSPADSRPAPKTES